MLQRLQKIIAASGQCSRRHAEELIASGRVRVDGQVSRLGDKADPAQSTILIDNKPIDKIEPFAYWLVNKPLGVVTTLDDPEGRRSVKEVVQDVPQRVFPVGRLDINTSGLLLMTNDGDLANRLAHPSHQVEKRYLVKIRGTLSELDRSSLEHGIRLEDGITAPAKVANVRMTGGHTWFEISLHEGRNRQVRRMCEALGYQVSRLMRVGYAFLTLNGLQPGQKRQLSHSEVTRLKTLK